MVEAADEKSDNRIHSQLNQKSQRALLDQWNEIAVAIESMGTDYFEFSLKENKTRRSKK